MLTELFTSKTRIKLFLKLFLNPEISCYLRELAKEFSLSPNALKEELDNLSGAGYLTRQQSGRSVYFQANTKHPFFPEIHSIVKKTLGIDQLLEDVLGHLGDVKAVYLLDDYARGVDSGLIDLLIVGDVDIRKLETLRVITEGKVNRKIRSLCVNLEEFEEKREVFMNRPNWKVV